MARFPYTEMDPARGAASLAPYLAMTLGLTREVDASGVLDTGASVNVLPYSVGLRLGADWDRTTTTVALTGNLRHVESRVLVVQARVGPFPPVRLAFAWAKSDEVPLLLGQVNFFMEFDVCFFRFESAFEVRPRPTPSRVDS